MAGRVELQQAPATELSSSPARGGLYFASTDKPIECFSSGNVVLDCVLGGGGWALGRVSNVVGDKSSGKTLLAIEGSNNFLREFPEGEIRYAEAEAAFDIPYAEALGMPVDRVDFRDDIFTVEDLFEDLSSFVDVDLATAEKLLAIAKKELTAAKKLTGETAGEAVKEAEENVKVAEEDLKRAKTQDSKPQTPKLYAVDSLDALSDREELSQAIDTPSFGGGKPKLIGKLFRRLIKKIEHSRCHLMIISQLRDKLGVSFGETQTRTGGRALDFYASQVLWLVEIGKLKKTVAGIERVYGVEVKARCKKNKVGLPFRECEFPIIFGYGVDDLTSGVEFLLQVNRSEAVFRRLELTKDNYKTKLNGIRNAGGDTARQFRGLLLPEVKRVWTEVELGFLPKASKY